MNAIEPFFFGKNLDQVLKGYQLQIDENKSLVLQTLIMVRNLEHVMEYSDIRVLEALFTLIRKGIERVVEYNEHFSEYPLSETI